MSTSTHSKLNPLMNLFLKREPAQPLPEKKPTKKIKSSDERTSDPLYQILSWRDTLTAPPTPPSHAARHYSATDLTKVDPLQWGANLQGIFLNIDWKNTSMDQLKALPLSSDLLSNGMAFVWGSKTNIGQLLDYMEQMGYVYAQNFTFVLLSRPKIPLKTHKKLPGNKSLLSFFSKQGPSPPPQEAVQGDYEVGRVEDPSQVFLNAPSQYFLESQKVLYMFRKVNKKESLELRHQRTSDVFFTIGEDDHLDWKAKEVVYHMIETLLINANYKDKQPLKLMELWSEKDYRRKGWITVSETKQGSSTQMDSREGLIKE